MPTEASLKDFIEALDEVCEERLQYYMSVGDPDANRDSYIRFQCKNALKDIPSDIPTKVYIQTMDVVLRHFQRTYIREGKEGVGVIGGFRSFALTLSEKLKDS